MYLLQFIFSSFDDFVYAFSNWQESLWLVRAISALVSIFLLFLIVILLQKILAMLRLPQEVAEGAAVPTIDKVTQQWQTIQSLLEKGDDANLKIAIIEADKLVGDILERAGFSGKDMGERMMGINQSQLRSISDLWQAHKVRNRIAHEADFKLTSTEAEEAIKNFRKALEDLGVL